MYHGEAIEDEGILDERAKYVWERASREWKDFGNREIAAPPYVAVTLRSLDTARKNLTDIREKFVAMTESVREKVVNAKKERLPPSKLAALNKPMAERTMPEMTQAAEAEMAIEPSYQELANELPRDQRVPALELAADLRAAEEYAKSTNSLRDQVNYSYWEVREIGRAHV